LRGLNRCAEHKEFGTREFSMPAGVLDDADTAWRVYCEGIERALTAGESAPAAAAGHVNG